MKPIKPKPMPKATEEWLSYGMETTGYALSPRQCRAILAALAYERKRADDAQARAHVADHLAAASKPGSPDDHVRHVEALRIQLGDARPSDFARVRAEVVTPEYQGVRAGTVFAGPGGRIGVLTEDGRMLSEDEFRREFTEAVVPKPRKPHSECAYMGCETHDPKATSRKPPDVYFGTKTPRRPVAEVDDRMAKRKAAYRIISKQFEQAERERKKKG